MTKDRPSFCSPCILIKEDSPESHRARTALTHAFEARGCRVFSSTQDAEKSDLIICIGGDGTLLSNVRRLGKSRSSAPILGIHGSRGLGFLHPLSLPEEGQMPLWSEKLVTHLLEDEYSLEKVWGLNHKIFNDRGEQVQVSGDCHFWALNDLVISKGTLSRMVSLEVLINNVTLWNHFRGDGLVVASSTGSTAYSLSAGGPVVHPSVWSLVVTPICSHEVFQRPLVLGANMKIKVTVLERSAKCYLTEDGQSGTELETGWSVEMSRSEQALPLLMPVSKNYPDSDYFERLRSKLGLGGRKKDA